MKLVDVAKAVNGTFEGNGDVEITAMASLLEAREGDISFLANQKYLAQMKETNASAVLVSADFQGETSATLIRVEDPNKAFASLAPIFGPKPVVRQPGIHVTAVIGENVTLGKDVYIGPHTVIEDGVTIGDNCVIEGLVFIAQDVKLGKGCHIYPQVNIREACILGDGVILHAGVKVGSDGYGYTVEIGPQGPVITKVPQVGPQAGVKEDVPEGEYVVGTPAVPKRKFAEGLLLPRLVDKLKAKVATLEAKVKELESK